jgi:hypothetical protein
MSKVTKMTIWNKYRRRAPEHRIDRLFVPEKGSNGRISAHGFESQEAVSNQDRERARSMRRAAGITPALPGWRKRERFDHPLAPELPGDQVTVLADRLEAACEDQVHCESLASSMSMRELRLYLIGTMLECFASYPDGALRTFTLLNRNWVFHTRCSACHVSIYVEKPALQSPPTAELWFDLWSPRCVSTW